LSLRGGATIYLNDAVNGAGMYINGGSASMAGGSIAFNTAQDNGNGGGIYNNAGSLTLRASVYVGPENSASQGGGMYLAKNSTTRITGCTVAGNVANTGAGVYEQMKPTVTPNPPILTDKDDPGGQPVQGS